MIKLTNRQKEYLPAIKWLINPYDHMGEGRSLALAYAFVELAIEHPGITVYFKDYVAPVLREDFRRTISMIIQENFKEYNFKINIQQLSIRVN
jgi:hypothetical protein